MCFLFYSTDLFKSYIQKWLKDKTEANGCPSFCNTDEAKEKYIADYYAHEGVQFEPDRLKRT